MSAGYDFIATREAVELVSEVLEPQVPDFQRLRKGVWGAPLSQEITAMLTLDHWKGGDFSIGYGISCAWIPFRYQSGVRIEWPTTIRQSHKHLWVDHFTIDAPRPRYVSQLHGIEQLQRSARKAVDEAGPRARDWWARVGTPDGVLAEARRQAASECDVHWPSARLVTAFTLARRGDLEGARSELSPEIQAWMEIKAGVATCLSERLEEFPGRFRAQATPITD